MAWPGHMGVFTPTSTKHEPFLLKASPARDCGSGSQGLSTQGDHTNTQYYGGCARWVAFGLPAYLPAAR